MNSENIIKYKFIEYEEERHAIPIRLGIIVEAGGEVAIKARIENNSYFSDEKNTNIKELMMLLDTGMLFALEVSSDFNIYFSSENTVYSRSNTPLNIHEITDELYNIYIGKTTIGLDWEFIPLEPYLSYGSIEVSINTPNIDRLFLLEEEVLGFVAKHTSDKTPSKWKEGTVSRNNIQYASSFSPVIYTKKTSHHITAKNIFNVEKAHISMLEKIQALNSKLLPNEEVVVEIDTKDLYRKVIIFVLIGEVGGKGELIDMGDLTGL